MIDEVVWSWMLFMFGFCDLLVCLGFECLFVCCCFGHACVLYFTIVLVGEGVWTFSWVLGGICPDSTPNKPHPILLSSFFLHVKQTLSKGNERVQRGVWHLWQEWVSAEWLSGWFSNAWFDLGLELDLELELELELELDVVWLFCCCCCCSFGFICSFYFHSFILESCGLLVPST
jgi:hypothetical protein